MRTDADNNNKGYQLMLAMRQPLQVFQTLTLALSLDPDSPVNPGADHDPGADTYA